MRAKSIFQFLFSVSIAFPSITFAKSEESSSKKKESSSYFESMGTAFSVCTNLIGISSNIHNLKSFDRRKATPGKYINAALTSLDLMTRSIYLASLTGLNLDPTGTLSEATNTAENVDTSWRSSKVIARSAVGLSHHLSNFFFVERMGCARLFYAYDLWEILSYANTIRTNSETLSHSMEQLLPTDKSNKNEDL